jgi:hypothetical protein
MAGFSKLDLGPLDRVGISVVDQPGATLLSLTADALGGRPQGIPAKWRDLIRAAAPPGTADVLRPMFAPGHSGVPYSLTPDMTARSVPDIPAYLEQLGDLPAEALIKDLESDFGGGIPPQWQSVVDSPRQWIASYVRVLQTVWDAFAPIWRAADPLRKREAERIGTAVVGDSLDVLLAGINSRNRFVGTTLYLPDVDPADFDLAGRRLLLIPVVSGSGASIFSFERPDVVWLGYPLPGLGLLWDDQPAPPRADDALTVVLGAVRATILRAAGRTPTMGELAGLVRCSAATATYHCVQLEAAGLLTRERRGRNVRLLRTPRGAALVDLMS